MTEHHLDVNLDNLAEGSPSKDEDPEPASPLKTTTVPQVADDAEKAQSIAETGLVSAVEIQAEGEDNDDAQDSPRTSGEMQTDPVSEKNASEMTDNAPLVLIIEDTTELAEVIQATLERMDMMTIHETHGNKALAKLVEMEPDVVLLDISLPDMTGWQIMDGIKEYHEQGGRMPIIIVITAMDDPANRLVGKLQGVYSYLIKPFTADEIERAVTQALSSTA